MIKKFGVTKTGLCVLAAAGVALVAMLGLKQAEPPSVS